jgi:hypothetical protein
METFRIINSYAAEIVDDGGSSELLVTHEA